MNSVSAYQPLSGEKRIELEKIMTRVLEGLLPNINGTRTELLDRWDFEMSPFARPSQRFDVTAVPNLCMTQYDASQRIVTAVELIHPRDLLDYFLQKFIALKFNVEIAANGSISYKWTISPHTHVYTVMVDACREIVENWKVEIGELLRTSNFRYIRNIDNFKDWSGLQAIINLMARITIDTFNSNIDKIHKALIKVDAYVQTSTKIQTYIKGKTSCSKQQTL